MTPTAARAGFHVTAAVLVGALSWPAWAETPVEDPIAVQKARAEWIQKKAKNVSYTKPFDLSGLPAYRPVAEVSGTIRIRGSNYLSDSGLQQVWEAGFSKFHPWVRFDTNLESTFVAVAALYMNQADLSHMGREPSWEELMAYQRRFSDAPFPVTIATGSYDVGGWTFALGVFVHKDNPIRQMSFAQVDGIFGAQRSGGWHGTAWHPEVARGTDKNIRTWGQLGLTGEWADKPIHVYGYNLNFHFPRFLSERVMGGGYMWNENMREYANKAKPDGGFILAGDLFMADLANDKYGIAYTGLAHFNKGTKSLALAEREGGPYVPLTLETVQDRSYPLTRDVYYYLNRRGGEPIDPKLKEFLRYVLSREGQEAVQRDGKFLPLTAVAAREQLARLEPGAPR